MLFWHTTVWKTPPEKAKLARKIIDGKLKSLTNFLVPKFSDESRKWFYVFPLKFFLAIFCFFNSEIWEVKKRVIFSSKDAVVEDTVELLNQHLENGILLERKDDLEFS